LFAVLTLLIAAIATGGEATGKDVSAGVTPLTLGVVVIDVIVVGVTRETHPFAGVGIIRGARERHGSDPRREQDREDRFSSLLFSSS
jgi:hypothetical protein